MPGFIIQGGGFVWDDASRTVAGVITGAPVINEFSPLRSNRRGTIAMAKLGSDPNSATSQWFINLVDNGSGLDTQNGGFTVFGEISAPSMAVVDAIANLPLINAGSPFNTLPIVGTQVNNTVQKSNLVLVSSATALSNRYQGLWWNANESGWGVSLTQQFGVIFAAWYTYDATGKPVWYVVSNCPVVGAGCTGALYRVTGGEPLTTNWNGTNPVNEVRSLTYAFSDAANGTINYVIDGVVTANRTIARQIY